MYQNIDSFKNNKTNSIFIIYVFTFLFTLFNCTYTINVQGDKFAKPQIPRPIDCSPWTNGVQK